MRFARSLLAVAFVFAASCGPAAAPVVHPVASATATVHAPPPNPDDAPLPIDARITKGTLPSGLTYYVLPHKKPEHRAQIWLAVNAGSVLEDEDQRGLAHFVEHMAFNGTKRFPKQAIVDMLEKSGVAFGADLNAYTSFDETVYTLQVPTDKPELLDRAIGVVRDWADGVTFDPVEVDKERGVVLEEWRLGRGAGMRLFDKQAPVLFHGSRYADRITIGKPEIIKGAPRDALVRFYKDWYRPELMSVVAVGDFDAKAVEARIQSEFASLKKSEHPRARTFYPVPPHDAELVSIETDPEATRSVVSITTKMPKRPLVSTRDYRRSLAERLYNAMLDARLDEIRRRPSAPFLVAGSHSGGFVRTEDAFTQTAIVKEGGVQDGFDALLEEDLRVARHGFVQSELDRAKANLLRSIQEAAKERETNDSRGFAQEIVRNFLENEAMPGIDAELALTQKLLPTIELAELDRLGETLGKGSRVVTISGPATMTKPTEAAILAATQTVEARDIVAYDDAVSNAPLMGAPPPPGPVVATREIPEIGVTEWTLKNGAHVVVKPTTFKNDEVRMVAFAPGGTSLARDADYDSVRFASTIAAQGGVGTFDAVSLKKALAGKVVSVSTQIGDVDQEVKATSTPADLEAMFQLVHLTFTAPRRDDGAFAAWKAAETESARNRRLSPESRFYDDLIVFGTMNHPRRRPITTDTVAHVDYAKALAFYKQRFADASGFTFVLVGNLDLARTKDLVEKYVGSLPAAGRHDAWHDPNVNRPAGVAKKTFAIGTEPKARVVLTFHGPETWSRDTDNDMQMLGEVLRIRLREILREDMGGVYGVSASGFIQRRPKHVRLFTISFGCAPENVEKLEKAVFAEIADLQKNGVAETYIDKVKALRRRAHETELRENGYWVRELERSFLYGDDPKLIVDFDSMLNKVSSDRVKAAARRYLASSQYVLGELRPAATP